MRQRRRSRSRDNAIQRLFDDVRAALARATDAGLNGEDAAAALQRFVLRTAFLTPVAPYRINGLITKSD